MTFKELNLSPLLLKALEEKGYVEPSSIQEQAIPHVLEGKDLLGCAQTGTGKTAAFALPIIQNLMKVPAKKYEKRNIRSLILTPTRELALQIQENFEAYEAHTPIKSTVIFGGVSQVPQIEALHRGVDILVATPGRLNDLVNQGEISLKNIEIFVLDEADRMLDMGFIHDVKKVLAHLPQKRQTLLFSATMPPEIQALTAKILYKPVTVEVTPVSSTVDLIDAVLYYVDKANKRQLLTYLIKKEKHASVLVFTRTKHGADRVAKYLVKAKITAAAIHGDKSQGARQRALSDFKSGAIQVLVATDIAARGIDISQLPCVINFDLPNIPETYVHRIGRTGRAGCEGVAISFSDFEEKAYVKDIEKLTGKVIPVIEEHPFPMEVFEILPKNTQARPVRNRQAANDDASQNKNSGKAAKNKSANKTDADSTADQAKSHLQKQNKNKQTGKQTVSGQTTRLVSKPAAKSGSQTARRDSRKQPHRNLSQNHI